MDSRHDSYYVHFIQLVQEHACFLELGEWYWQDTGYSLNKWLISLYKSLDSEQRDNRIFNTSLSKIQIKNEHALSYLKER